MPTEKLAACLAATKHVFGAEVNPEQAFFDLGGDSLHAIELVVRVHELTGVQLNAYEMVNAESLAAFFARSIGIG